MLRRDVIREIVARDRQRLGLRETDVMREARVLYAAACEHFGTWDTALRYAGVDTRHLRARRDLSRDRVVKTIRKLCISSYSLAAKDNMRRDRTLYRAALRHFGSWKQALEAAGINVQYAQIKAKPRRLNKKQIIETLQQRHREGLSLAWSDVCLENRALATAAKNAFHGWGRALAAAGILPNPPRATSIEKWDKGQVIARIQERHRRGAPMNSVAVNKDYPALVSAVRRLFGQWYLALEAAGVVLENQTENCQASTTRPSPPPTTCVATKSPRRSG